MEEQNKKKKVSKGAIITVAAGILGLTIGGVSIFNFNFNISMPKQQAISSPTDITETGGSGVTTVITDEGNKEHSKEIANEEVVNLSYKDYIGKWKLHPSSYMGKELYSEIEINNVDEINKTISLTYNYSISPVLASNDTTGQGSVTISYKNEKITVLYPDENEITNIRKEEVEALTTDLFIFEDTELRKIRSCKLAIAEDGNLYANYTENGSFDYETTLCTK